MQRECKGRGEGREASGTYLCNDFLLCSGVSTNCHRVPHLNQQGLGRGGGRAQDVDNVSRLASFSGFPTFFKAISRPPYCLCMCLFIGSY